MQNFVQRRLMQMEATPIGECSGYRQGRYMGHFAVSLVRLAGDTWTRVTCDTYDMTWHYPGTLAINEAAEDAASELWLMEMSEKA